VPDDAVAVAAFGYEPGLLKRIRRSGWWHAGVPDPESVAEHTMRAAQLAAILAVEEGAEPQRAALWHDGQESRTGICRTRPRLPLSKPDPRRITGNQTVNLPERSREFIRGATTLILA
jgi:putative hydrolase of HD superfamily